MVVSYDLRTIFTSYSYILIIYIILVNYLHNTIN